MFVDPLPLFVPFDLNVVLEECVEVAFRLFQSFLNEC